MQRRLTTILSADVVGYSRLMEIDEASTLTALKTHRRDLIDPKVLQYRGRTIKLMGDGALLEFPSVVDAVSFAIEVQRAMHERNVDVPKDRRILFRIGINVGDIIVDDEDIYGEGVNLASRLEGLAQPGGVCISAEVARIVRGKVDVPLADLGTHTVKNIREPVHAYSVNLFAKGLAPPGTRDQELRQNIRYCRASDGVQIAYASVGEGPPLVKAANWMSHLEFDWESPVWRHWFAQLAKTHHLVRYDERGNGLSDWGVEDLSFEALVNDLETVVEAAGLERFPLLGLSQGCAVSVAYAVRHPEKVSALVLYGGYTMGWGRRSDAQEIERRKALLQLTRLGWGQDNPAFRQVFTSMFIPDANPAQMTWFNELERMTTSPENAVRLQETFADIDVRPLLPQVQAPTLVLHCYDDSVAPFDAGREFAKGIPQARFVPLEGANHILLEHEPAWPKFLAEVQSFLAEHAPVSNDTAR